MCSFLTRLYCDLDIKGLSPEASEAIADLRDRIQETLYHVVRETHPKEVASSRFGNLLLFIPSVMVSPMLSVALTNSARRQLHGLIPSFVYVRVAVRACGYFEGSYRLFCVDSSRTHSWNIRFFQFASDARLGGVRQPRNRRLVRPYARSPDARRPPRVHRRRGASDRSGELSSFFLSPARWLSE